MADLNGTLNIIYHSESLIPYMSQKHQTCWLDIYRSIYRYCTCYR